ncbi:hypothetical protein LOD99_3386 [Oopsacas minuta]|uniref:Large ribosomal subunit protein mL37 n=1 Tax=Oopsacas minuta TaxID=111878 RepID=A0AAV7JXG0_9METZ|nr:hypothetical protein LOD99_3386 [Oopsacas minuta]
MLLLRSKTFLTKLYYLGCSNLSTESESVQPLRSHYYYGFHPNVTTIDAPYQSMVLTKTLHYNQLPHSLSQNSDVSSSIEQLVRDAIVLTVGKDKRVLTRKYKEKPENELNTDDYYLSLIMNLLRIALTPQGVYQPVLTYRSYIAYDWIAMDTYSHMEELIRMRGRPFGWLISSSQDKASPLVVPDPDEVRELSQSPLHDLYPVSPLIGLPKCTFYHDSSDILPANEQFRVPHTLLYIHNMKLSHVQNFQSVVMHLFSLLASYATRYCGATPGHELATPLSAQAILTTGTKYTYFYYQLNTLDIAQIDTGLKNLLYTSDSEIQLYQFDLKQDKIIEFNLECLRLFVDTLNNFRQINHGY